jgi:hypothetical protein
MGCQAYYILFDEQRFQQWDSRLYIQEKSKSEDNLREAGHPSNV